MRCAAASSKTPWVTAGARVIPSIRSAIFCVPRVIGSRSVNKNDSMRPSRQMRRISVSKSPTAAPSKCETSSIKTYPPTADAWPLVSSSAYQPVPSPKSLAWAGPYASGRTHSTPTSTQAEPATHPTEAINGHYRTRQTHRQRLPQPHQLPTPNAPHHRRPRRLHPHSTRKSYKSTCIPFAKHAHPHTLLFDEVGVDSCGCVHVRPLWERGCALVVTVHSWCICVLRRVAW